MRVSVPSDLFGIPLRGIARATDETRDVRAVPVIVIGRHLFGCAVEDELFVVLTAVQIRSLFQSRIYHRDADLFSAGAIGTDSIEPKCPEQGTRSDISCAIDRSVRCHDRVG